MSATTVIFDPEGDDRAQEAAVQEQRKQEDIILAAPLVYHKDAITGADMITDLFFDAYVKGHITSSREVHEVLTRCHDFANGIDFLPGGRTELMEYIASTHNTFIVDIATEWWAGFDAVFNVRLETSKLANSRRNGEGVAGVEMLAFGTAVRFPRRFASS